MSDKNSAVAVYDNHVVAEQAVQELQRSGFDMKKLSIVGKDYHTDEHVVGYYTTGDRMKFWGETGCLLGRDFRAFVWVGGLIRTGDWATCGRRTDRGVDCGRA
jgi:hypothetical protein